MGSGCSLVCSLQAQNLENQNNEQVSTDLQDMTNEISTKPYRQSLIEIIQPSSECNFDDIEQLEQELLSFQLQLEPVSTQNEYPEKKNSNQLKQYYFDLEDEFSDILGPKVQPSPGREIEPIYSNEEHSLLTSPLQLSQFNQSILLYNNKNKPLESPGIRSRVSDTQLKSILKQRKSTLSSCGLSQKFDLQGKMDEMSQTSSRRKVRFQTRTLNNKNVLIS